MSGNIFPRMSLTPQCSFLVQTALLCSSIALCNLPFCSTSLFVSPSFFFFLLTIPLCCPRLLHFFPFLIILSGGGTLNVWEWRQAQVSEKSRQTNGSRAQAVLFKHTGWQEPKNSSKMLILVSLTRWSVEIWFRVGALTQTETQSLTVWQTDCETPCQPDRQFAKEAASASHSRFWALSLPIPVVIHQDRSSLPLFSVQTEIMNQQYEERERIGTVWAEGLKQKQRVITSWELMIG